MIQKGSELDYLLFVLKKTAFDKATSFRLTLDTINKLIAELEALLPPDPADFKLCYVRHGQAWFTTAPLAEQWGDDWNDAPYDCNAGDPYAWSDRSGKPPYELLTLKYEGMYTPADLDGHTLSVQDINSGRMAWLSADTIQVFAGASVQEFKTKVRAAGGKVYMEDTRD